MSVRDLLPWRHVVPLDPRPPARPEWERLAGEIIDSGIGIRRCTPCDVTWRGLRGSACWCCGRPS